MMIDCIAKIAKDYLGGFTCETPENFVIARDPDHRHQTIMCSRKPNLELPP